MFPRVAASVVVFALLSMAPAVEAAPDARIHDDASRCLEALPDDAFGNATCVVFYGHVEDMRGGGFLNAERPPDGIPQREHGVWGPSAPPYWDLHRFDFALQSGPIEYQPDGGIGALPGAFRDLLPLVDDVPLFAKVHMTVDQTAFPGELGSDQAVSAGVLPCLTVDVHFVADEEVLSSGSVVGHLVRPGAETPEMECADEGSFWIDEEGITTFGVEVPAPGRDVVQGERIQFVVHAYAHDASGSRFTPSGVRLVQGPHHLNHVVVPVDAGLQVVAVRPQWQDGRLYVRTNVSNPWGAYDIDHETLDLQVVAPDGSVVAARALGDIEGPVVQYGVVHGAAIRPLTAYFEWDLLTEGLKDGKYVLRVSADNAQHLTRATAEASFVLEAARLSLYDADGLLLQTARFGSVAEAPSAVGLHFLLMMATLVLLSGRPRRPS